MRETTGVGDSRSAGPIDRGRLPNFIIIGAMRSGTTSLTRYLRPHPEVFMAERKELHFFDFRYEHGLDRYRENFVGAGSATAVGEATPNYMHSRIAMERIAEQIPDIRLVAILRNPVDRAYSHYWHYRSVGIEKASFEDALAREGERLSGDTRALARWSYVDRGRYHRQLVGICERFPREALLVLIFDDLRDSPDVIYRALCAHLGIDETFQPERLGTTANTFVEFRSKTVRRVARRLPRSTRKAVGRLNTRADASYPPMDPAVRSVLLESFRQDNRLLADWLGRDLSSWDR